MDIRPIRTDADHAAVLREIEVLWGAAENTPEGDRLDVLATLVDAYEETRWPIADLDPVETIEAAMAREGLTQADLAALLGSKSRASEILRRKRPLTLPMIRRIAREWRVPEALLVREYPLDNARAA
jgi:HTH-type transcriptional regulator / antitoxin HigA